MISNWQVILMILVYLGVLFLVAFVYEKFTKGKIKWRNNSNVYALSLAVYCTAWTFYGSVGMASNYLIEYLAVYLGPTITAPLWWLVLRKMIRISKVQRISSLSDFISSRYGKNILLGRVVSVFFVIGIIPYIALQIKAIEQSIKAITSGIHTTSYPHQAFVGDIAFYITIGLGIFITLFTTRDLQSSDKNTGMIGAIAFESIFKLLAFLVVGVFVTYGIFNGFDDIFSQIPEGVTLKLNSSGNYSEWFGMLVLSGMAVLFLPRQFEVAVVENGNERQVNRAMWLFPLYMLLINLFVLPIAIAGNTLLSDSDINADLYVLAIPLMKGANWIASLSFLGGFAASTGMIIVSTHALSKMLSNSIIMPLVIDKPIVERFLKGETQKLPGFIRRVSIFITLLLAYLYYIIVAERFSLISIGLISFVAVSQFAPSIIGGIYWKKGNMKGALWGIFAGFSIWFYHLVFPSFPVMGIVPGDVINWSIGWIEASSTSAVTQVFFWSMLVNGSVYFLVSTLNDQTSIERNQAEIFVDIFKYSKAYESSVVWKGMAQFPDIKSLLIRFLGKHKTEHALAQFADRHQLDLDQPGKVDSRLINHAEKLLTGVIGTASARILVASVAKEEEIQMQDVVDILQESQELLRLNKELVQKSEQLKRATDAIAKANRKLKENDEQKDEFLYTVTHELRTPLTSIRALSEILSDNDDIPADMRTEYLNTIVKETDRMTRLISQVLDLENFESGTHQLSMGKFHMPTLIDDCIQSMSEVFKSKHIHVQVDLQRSMKSIVGDEDRITQVILNLLSNAVKYCDQENGKITVTTYVVDGYVKVNISDNGRGIKPDMQKVIFEKFFQAKNQTIRKPKGSGLGLAISKKIVDLHEGRIWVDSEVGKGSKFSFTVPYHENY